MSTDQYVWPLAGQKWIQSSEGQAFTQPALEFDSDFAIGAWRSSDCTPACGTWPAEFAFCPLCCAARPAAARFRNDEWIPPFGTSTGQRLTATLLSLDETTHQSSPLPADGRYQFLVVPSWGHYPALLAHDANGAGWLWQSARKAWLQVSAPGGRWPSCELAQSSRAAAAGASGWIVLPGETGPAKIRLNAVDGNVRILTGSGKCLTGIAGLGGQAYALVSEGSSLALEIASLESADQWTSHQITSGIASKKFSAPLIDAVRGRIFWVGESGYVTVDAAATTPGHTSWTPWPSENRGCVDLGPAYGDTQGNLWQLCQSDTNGYSYIRLGSANESHECDGPRISTGKSSYRMQARMRKHPWLEDELVTVDGDAELRLPLLENPQTGQLLYMAVDYDRAVSDFFATSDRHFVELKMEGEAEALFTGPLHKPWESTLFIYLDRLFFYHPDLGLLHSWKLHDA